MLPLNFSRGTPITADHLNSLVNEIRSSSLTPGMGYTLNKTPNGTSLSISQPSNGGGGGGDAAVASCPFEVTDISEPNPSGGQMTLRLNVKCEYVRAYGIWPTGTSEANPNHVIVDIPVQEGWYGIYLWIELDQQGNLSVINGAVSPPEVVWDLTWVESTSTDFYVYLAGVNVSTDSGGDKYISYIENACPIIDRPVLPSCRFLTERVIKHSGSGERIQIRSDKINGAYPTGMDAINTYILSVSDSSPYWYLYCVMVVSNGQIQTGENDITFEAYDNIKTSTDTLVYFLIAEYQVGHDEAGDPVIEYIYNYCQQPFAIPVSACPFRITNASEGSTQQVEITFGYVDNFVPHGMPVPPATTPPLTLPITEKSYIYCAMTYDSSSFSITDGESIVFSAEATTKSNTSLVQYVLVGTVDYEDGKIKSISNICQNIVADSCSLAWSTPA